MMKFVSWNVNGFRAVLKKGFEEVFDSLDADFICLQETKMQAGQADFHPEDYYEYYNYAEKKGYSGTAIFARKSLGEPLSVSYGINGEHDDEGRVITLEYPEFYLICCYTPNAQDGLARIGYRCEFEDAMREYQTLTKLQEGLKEGKSVRLLDLDDNDREWIRNYGLLTSKPVIYVANMGEEEIADPSSNAYFEKVSEFAAGEGSECIAISVFEYS